MLIGELSEKSGVSRDTLRYYEKLGMLKPDHRGRGNYREYGTDVFSILSFIKKTQVMGFTLSEIKEMLPSKHQPYSCATLWSNVSDKFTELDEEIAKLQGYKNKLTSLKESCTSEAMSDVCDSFEKLWIVNE